jgi:hypothetical protein
VQLISGYDRGLGGTALPKTPHHYRREHNHNQASVASSYFIHPMSLTCVGQFPICRKTFPIVQHREYGEKPVENRGLANSAAARNP